MNALQEEQDGDKKRAEKENMEERKKWTEQQRDRPRLAEEKAEKRPQERKKKNKLEKRYESSN